MLRLIFQRVSLLSLLIFRCLRIRSYRIARRPLYWLVSCEPAAEWPCYTPDLGSRRCRRRRHRLWPGSHGCSRWRSLRTPAGLPAHPDRTACGSRTAWNQAGCRSGCRRHWRWPCQLPLSHLCFQHRSEFALCFGYQTCWCLGTGHFSSPRPSTRDRRNSCRRHYGRRKSPRCRRSWSRSSSQWRCPGSEPRSSSHLH